MNFWTILYVIDWGIFTIVSLTVLYMTIFTIASQFSRHTNLPKAKRQNRFIVLIPSYKRDKVIEQTVMSILGQTYPQRFFDITVISDHQSEITNFHLAQQPITLLTPNFEYSTKAKSLQLAINNLPQFKIYDIVVILDADNIVEPEFLEQLNDAFECAGTKAIQVHRLSRNRETAAARLDAIFEEINNSIFRRGHITLGLSAAIAGSGMAFDFNWFKKNIMNANTAYEDKELEAMLMRQDIYVDYFDNILVFDEKAHQTEELNRQRSRWVNTQLHIILKNIKYLPIALLNKQYSLADKIIQWMLIPRTILMGIIVLMSIVLPIIYMTSAIKWWLLFAFVVFVFALATPDYLVDKNWNNSFLKSPTIMFWAILSVFGIKRKQK